MHQATVSDTDTAIPQTPPPTAREVFAMFWTGGDREIVLPSTQTKPMPEFVDYEKIVREFGPEGF